MYRDINYFKKVYHPGNSIVKDKKGDLVTDWHSFKVRWRNHFFKFLNVQGINDVRQKEIHTAEPIVPGSSAFEVEMANE